MSGKSRALATVTSPGFLPGTLVMLHSFLHHNRWFDGDLVIIHQDLSAQDRAQLLSHFDRLIFVQPRPELVQNVQQLVQEMPSFAQQKTQFYSLEAIGLTAYDHVLFCDSDLLFQATVQELFAMPYALICSGDGSFYRGTARHPKSFVEMSDDVDNIGLHCAFNAGFMLMDRSIRTPQTLAKLIDMVDPRTWGENATGHTDQLLFNVVFHGKQHIVGPEYNYVLRHHKEILKRSGLSPKDAKVLHFNGAAKPWDPVLMHRVSQSDAGLAQAATRWNDAFRALMKRT